jgi:ABC-type lipoprotein release transport system permease subunit
MDISQAKKMLGLDNKISKIIAFAKSPNDAIKIAKSLDLAQKVFTWQDLNMMFADIMRIQRNMVSVILFAIIFLAITTSIASLVLFINMKKREISILTILGAKKSQNLLENFFVC